MDSREVLRQYLMGAMDASAAISLLYKLQTFSASVAQMQEAARARYVIGFITRARQFIRNEISARDLCLNLRDIVLILGRIKLPENLYIVVEEFGSEFDLYCESDYQVSCPLNVPSWLKPKDYVSDVYSLKYDKRVEFPRCSAGDTILTQHTCFSSYKSFEQKVAVHTALDLPNGDTLLLSQPTGGGKSLVTQLLASTTNKLTVVIVPTVALALDQYYAAKNNLIGCDNVFCYRGDQSANDREQLLNAIRDQSARMVITSPEAILKNHVFRQLLDKAALKQYLYNVVVDEAHVVPDWGVYFRPDFQVFSVILKKWKELSCNQLRTFLLSATLSDDVVRTLFALFGTEGHNSQLRCDSLRHEPRFYFYPVKSLKEQDEKTIEAIKLLPKPLVVYVLEPREAKLLQKKLKKMGFSNIPVFTGETTEKQRDFILNGWKKHLYDVVVATSAFGIGVDKPDVRTIIHACCPENLSRFYQEVGRGGRDQLPSLSLLIPYQSKYDSNSDVRRALGLVNKRVLTVERSVSRWFGMINNPSAIIDSDECILNTSSTPPTMTDDEVECAGSRNVAWNVNLLLFLHRTGFIDLLDADYIYLQKARPQKSYYTITIKLLKPDILGDPERLSSALCEPRKAEYESQMEGYRILSELITSPKAKCWGKVIKSLFPLAKEVCNGCPCDPRGRVTTDDLYKIRCNPNVVLLAQRPEGKIGRRMGSFNQLIVKRNGNRPCSLEEVELFSEKAEQNGIGVFVAPQRFMGKLSANKLLMDYSEFLFAAAHCPYLFSRGVACVFDNDHEMNAVLFKSIEKLSQNGYYSVLYCSENEVIISTGKPLRESVEGYSITIDKL